MRQLPAMTSGLRHAILLGALPAAIACEAPGDAATPPLAWTVGDEPITIFGSAGDDPDTGFGYVADVVRGPDGTLAVADGLLYSLSFFTADGELRATAGREGEGPGEFSEIAALVSTPEGRLFVFDQGLQRLSEWTFDGDHVGDTRLTRQGVDRPIGGVGRLGDGSWYARDRDRLVAAPLDGMARDTVGFFRLADGVVGAPVARIPGVITASFELMGPGARQSLLSPRPVGAVREGCLLAGATDESVLAVVDIEGNRVGEVRLDLEVERATRAHRDDWLAGALATAEVELGPEGRTMLERMAATVPMADVVPFGSDLIVDAFGYIWVQRYLLPDGYPSSDWRVFTETGTAVGTVALPAGFRAVEVSGDAILGVFTHEMGLEDVRVYPLDRRGDAQPLPGLPGCG